VDGRLMLTFSETMITAFSHNPAETEALGEAWGREAQRGWVIALTGDLGAGKTQLVRGLARGLGCTARVHSPTFTLVNTYEGGRLTLFHLDLYRLETLDQIHGAGVDEYLEPDGVAVIEWAERMLERGARNAEHGIIRRVNIEVVDDNTRRIDYEDTGA
jgi:tRNA threonylcarbamoyladenosine biosynthesis protein TsaE